jgi:MFS family permease
MCVRFCCLIQGSSASGRLCQALFGCGRREVATLWIVSLVYGLPLGVFNGWSAILAINLQDVGGLSTTESGWIGCVMTLSGCLAAIASAARNDKHPGRLKKWIVISNMIASVCFALFGVRALGLWVPESKLLSNIMVFGCSVAGGLFLNLPMPLFYELGVEQVNLLICTSMFCKRLMLCLMHAVFVASGIRMVCLVCCKCCTRSVPILVATVLCMLCLKRYSLTCYSIHPCEL